MSQNPTENLRRGRRRIEEIPEIILLKDWTWDVVTKRFYLHIRVCLDHDGKDIPRVTEWFVTAETVYPFGTIAIYPSCKNSITNTFPHQSINAFAGSYPYEAYIRVQRFCPCDVWGLPARSPTRHIAGGHNSL